MGRREGQNVREGEEGGEGGGEGERREGQDVREGEGERREGQDAHEGEGGGEGERREGQDAHEGEGGGEGERREGQDVREGVGEVEREGHDVHGDEGEREEQNVREGEGEVEEEREGCIGPQPEEAAEPKMQPEHPAGHTEYSLSPELKPNPIKSQVQFLESYLELARDHFDSIDQKYNEALEKRREIDTLLKEFKEKLGLQADADFPTCYQQLIKRVRKPESLQLSSKKPLQITLEREANGGGVQEAVDKFNSMLWKCNEFPAQMQAAAEHIKEKMQAIEGGCSHTEKTRMALEISKTSLEQIHTFGEDIEKLVWDVEFARSYLASKVTGLLLVLPTNS